MIVDKDAIFPNSMGLPSKARFVIYLKSKEDIVEACKFAKKEDLPLIPLGDGTNILPHNFIDGIIAILDIRGKGLEGEILKVGAGENWDEIVAFAVEQELSGIEALSAIPGKAGATPIQNIGAYGKEIKDVIISVEAYDREKEEFVTLSNEECRFEYRDSIFKRYPSRWIIVSITLKLQYSHDRKNSVKIPDYKDVKKYFEERGDDSPSLKEIRNAIIEIRKNKLPDPKVVPNCGSFFKNPFVSKEKAEEIKKESPDITIFPGPDDRVKIPAGFLIEQAGFKGKSIGKVEVYKNNALVLTNPNNGNFEDLSLAKEVIQKSVFEKFGILLEPEVNIIN